MRLRDISIVLLLSMFFVSCATKTKIEYRDRDVNHYITNTTHDTIFERTRDSVYHEVKHIGDTIYCIKYTEVVRWRDRVVERHDTCWRDSILVNNREIEKEVIKYPRTYWYAVVISLIFLLTIITRIVRWLRTL